MIMGNTINLRKIDETNWKEAIQLKVSEDQEEYVASNLYSIAQFQFLKDFRAMGLYMDEQMVGFAMYGIDSDDGNYWIYRLMIDKKYQGRGVGKQAIGKILEDIKANNTGGIRSMSTKKLDLLKPNWRLGGSSLQGWNSFRSKKVVINSRKQKLLLGLLLSTIFRAFLYFNPSLQDYEEFSKQEYVH
jgi:GNAT superfamily N-acetyltransferase